MVNKQKIITMTKLAMYDKHEGEADRQANEYFRHDYLYRKNLHTRLSVGLGGLILVGAYWLRLIFIDGMDIFTEDLQQYMENTGLFIVALLAVYSLIGTVQGTREYFLMQKRISRYLNWMRQLERIETRASRQAQAERAEADSMSDRNSELLYNPGEPPRGHRPRHR